MMSGKNGGGWLGPPPSGVALRTGRLKTWARRWRRVFWMGAALVVLAYSASVLVDVIGRGSIGARCVFGTRLEVPVLSDYEWRGGRPEVGDELLAIGGQTIGVGGYADYIQAVQGLKERIGRTVEVRWREARTGRERTAQAVVRRPPASTYFWSCAWFAQELLILAIGARVFWKRPGDGSALLFFVLCLVTVGAFMGGYYWTEIVTEWPLIHGFAFFAVFVPVVNLHFYLVFPRERPIFQRYRRAILALLYGGAAAFLAALSGGMLVVSWLAGRGDGAGALAALAVVRGLALSYIGVAALIFGLCVVCLVHAYRHARKRAERNQVQWVLLAAVIASVLIAGLLVQSWRDPSTLGSDIGAWPMLGVWLVFTIAHAFSITRYKLMQVEAIINRSAVHLAFSRIGGWLYSAMLLVGGKLIGDRLFAPGASVFEASAGVMVGALVLVLLEVAKARFQRELDRQFFREKYKFDEAMKRMRLAVGSLVDRTTLGRRLLEAAGEVLRLEWGALYLLETGDRTYQLVASHGPPPEEPALSEDNPMVARLRESPTVRLSHANASQDGTDPVSDTLIALGGEVATAVGADGELAGLLVLGPKRSGMPYENEEMAFLGALGSVAAMVLHSADIQGTLEGLNQDLRGKVDKIAEQQRRILILQDQLRDRAGRERDEAGLDASGPDRDVPAPGDDSGPAVFGGIKGSSASVRKLIAMARKVAASHSAVLVRGESGTGKELLAAAIHHASPRAALPFVKVHCAALSQSLLESELFGHVKGAFTGADRDRIGRFEQANGGTLFLDEIGDINLEVQTKLLRVLQEMSFERVGSSQPVNVDVRIVAATHQDLEALIAAGRFREDLYYRLNVICLHTPSLRERREDIFELALHFLNQQARRTGKAVTHLDPETVEALVAYDWPGNVRELENLLERAVVLAEGPAVMLGDLPPELHRRTRRGPRPRLAGWGGPGPTAAPAGAVASGTPEGAAQSTFSPRAAAPGRSRAGGAAFPRPDDDWNAELGAYERQRLLDALDEARGNKSTASRLLGMPRSTFISKLKKHGIA